MTANFSLFNPLPRESGLSDYGSLSAVQIYDFHILTAVNGSFVRFGRGGGGSSPVVAGVLLPNLKRFGNNSHQEQKIDTELCGYSFYSNSSD